MNASDAVRELLRALGEGDREGLRETPDRVATAYAELLSGRDVEPSSVLEALPAERHDGLILVKDIRLASLCEHHLLPFIGTAAIAYLPGDEGEICGISKLTRLIDVLGKRLQVQERLVEQAADALEKALQPAAIFVYAEAEHLCMTMRGARAEGSKVITTAVRGVWLTDAAARAEIMNLIR
ncbi:MAG: GTP cyclohydrolase I FolE [Actinomycetota bacterium]